MIPQSRSKNRHRNIRFNDDIETVKIYGKRSYGNLSCFALILISYTIQSTEFMKILSLKREAMKIKFIMSLKLGIGNH